jgi:hypothetical protein
VPSNKRRVIVAVVESVSRLAGVPFFAGLICAFH